jgi:hypothetical protein
MQILIIVGPSFSIHPPPVPTTPKVSQASQIKQGAPNSFDTDREQGQSFLISCELYMSLIASDFPDDQVRIQSYFKSRCTVTFAKHVVRQEMKSGQMTFTD